MVEELGSLLLCICIVSNVIDSFCNFDMDICVCAIFLLEKGREEGQLFKQSD